MGECYLFHRLGGEATLISLSYHEGVYIELNVTTELHSSTYVSLSFTIDDTIHVLKFKSNLTSFIKLVAFYLVQLKIFESIATPEDIRIR